MLEIETNDYIEKLTVHIIMLGSVIISVFTILVLFAWSSLTLI